MRRAISVLLCLVIIVQLSVKADALSFGSIGNRLFENVKGQVLSQVNTLLSREVTFGGFETNLIDSVTLTDVRIAKNKKLSGGSVINIKKAKVYYNIFKAATAKDFLPAISRIDIDGADVYLEHEKDGSWNLQKLAPTGGPSDAPPPVFRAKIYIKNSKLKFVDKIGFTENKLSKDFERQFISVDGLADFSRNNSLYFEVLANTGKEQVKSSGKVNLTNGVTSVSVKALGLNAADWNRYLSIPVVKDIPLLGSLNADVAISTPPKFSVAGLVSISNGRLYDRTASGSMQIDLNDKGMNISFAKSTFAKGNVHGNIGVGFGPGQKITGKMFFENAGISDASGGIYSMAGTASGVVDLQGPPDALSIKLAATLNNAAVFGQDATGLTAQGLIKKDLYIVEHAAITSQSGVLTLEGEITKDLKFDLTAKTMDFALNNSYFLGGISGDLRSLFVKASGKVDAAFINDPFSRINANGSFMLTRCLIGGQQIDLARGNIELSKGLLSIVEGRANIGTSTFYLSAEAGPGHDSTIFLAGRSLLLEDFPFLNQILPDEIKGVTGKADLNILSAGKLPKKIAGLEDLSNSLSTSVEVNLSGVTAGRQEIDRVAVALDMKGKSVKIRSAYAISGASHLVVYGSSSATGMMNFGFYGNLDLGKLKPLTAKFSKLSGKTSFSGLFGGEPARPYVTAFVSGESLVYESASIDRLQGYFRYRDGIYEVLKPTTIFKDGDEYPLDLYLNLKGQVPEFKGSLVTKRGGLSSAYGLGLMAYYESVKRRPSTNKPHVSIKTAAFALPSLQGFVSTAGKYILYRQGKSFLADWIKIDESVKKYMAGFSALGLSPSGPLTADIRFNGKNGKIDAQVYLESKKCRVGKYSIDELLFDALITNSVLKIKKCSLKKGSGDLAAYGSADFAGPLKIQVLAKKLAVDGLESVANLPVPLKGNLSASVEITGNATSPEVKAAFAFEKADIGELSLDDLSGRGSFAAAVLNLDELAVRSGSQKASLRGLIPFTNKKKMDVRFVLDGQNAGLLFSAFKGYKWEEGSGKAKIVVGGYIDAPIIDGYVQIRNGRVRIEGFNSKLEKFNVGIEAVRNIITVNTFEGYLTGALSAGKRNWLSIAGIADISQLFKQPGIVRLDAQMADVKGTVDLPGIYSGDINLSGAAIKGPLVISGNYEGNLRPVIYATVELSEGSIKVPKASSGGASKKIDIGFEITGNINKNVNLIQESDGRLISLDLSKMNLEIAGKNIYISGSLSAPRVLGVVEVKSGAVSILGRDFEILTEVAQEAYFGLNRSMLIKNEAVFSGGTGPDAIYPNIYLTAKSAIQMTKQDASPSGTEPVVKEKENFIILTRITGKPFVQEKGKMLALQFFSYKEDKTKSPSEMVSQGYDENQIRIMLLPDVVRDTLFGKGSQGAAGGMNANAMIGDYIDSSVQSFQTAFFRKFSGGIEKALGLDSFTLGYNFGKDIQNLLPQNMRTENATKNTSSQLDLSIGQGFFERIYIKLRYSQAMAQTTLSSNTSLNYQVTLKVDKNLSLVYYREPITFQDSNSTYYKMTLESVVKL